MAVGAGDHRPRHRSPLDTGGDRGGVSVDRELGPRRPNLTGAHGLAVPRPRRQSRSRPARWPGEYWGLLAQTETAIALRPHLGPVLKSRVEAAETALWTGLQSLVTHGRQPRPGADRRTKGAVIAKMTHGRSAVRALAYDHGPGRADEHVHPRKVYGKAHGTLEPYPATNLVPDAPRPHPRLPKSNPDPAET